MESLDRVLDVNLRGTFFLAQAVAPKMRDAPARDRPRSITTATSASATIVSLDRAEYCVPKTALSKLFPLRLREMSITPYEVRAGVIRTDMSRLPAEKCDQLIAAGLTPIARWGKPEDVGRAIACLASDHVPLVTADTLHVDGGLHIHKL